MLRTAKQHIGGRSAPKTVAELEDGRARVEAVGTTGVARGGVRPAHTHAKAC